MKNERKKHEKRKLFYEKSHKYLRHYATWIASSGHTMGEALPCVCECVRVSVCVCAANS